MMNNNIVSDEIKTPVTILRERIKKQTEEFLKNGGKIQYVKSGVSGKKDIDNRKS